MHIPLGNVSYQVCIFMAAFLQPVHSWQQHVHQVWGTGGCIPPTLSRPHTHTQVLGGTLSPAVSHIYTLSLARPHTAYTHVARTQQVLGGTLAPAASMPRKRIKLEMDGTELGNLFLAAANSCDMQVHVMIDIIIIQSER